MIADRNYWGTALVVIVGLLLLLLYAAWCVRQSRKKLQAMSEQVRLNRINEAERMRSQLTTGLFGGGR
jgi:heme/copper-type cytochrome/quinol oxidase subunit 2